MQQMNAALSDKQKTALDVLTRLVESDPSLVEKLLASKEPEQVEE